MTWPAGGMRPVTSISRARSVPQDRDSRQGRNFLSPVTASGIIRGQTVRPLNGMSGKSPCRRPEAAAPAVSAGVRTGDAVPGTKL